MIKPVENMADQFQKNIENITEMRSDLSAAGLFSLGFWLQSLTEIEKAKACYEAAIQKAPQYQEAFFNLGVISYARSEVSQAIAHFKKAIQIKPDLADAWSAVGIIWSEQNRFDEALVCLEQALLIDPDLTIAHYHMGLALQRVGRYEDSLNSYRNALACKPDFAPAYWLNLLSLPILYEIPEQIGEHRRRFTANLAKLTDTIQLNTTEQKQFALAGIRTSTNFYLQYQGKNDRDLQTRYGELVHRVMATNYPQWAHPKPVPDLEEGAKIRIGYVSSFMFAHTVGIFLSGWVENHTSSDFQIHCYHLGNKCDGLTRHIKDFSHAFHCFSGDIEAAARQIEADRLHILVYTDIGMNTETMELAALRLAPIQCKGWGHPVTTGLPTMDYYLSSDLMEPPDGERHYSEELVRLPNLALCYRPRSLPQNPKTKKTLGIPEGRFIYLSTQSLFKYLPQHDDIYPRIAKQVPEACFVFIGNQSPMVSASFMQRLRGAFREYHLDADRFCHMCPRLNGNDFMSLNMAADVLMDTLEWSGGKTTLEAIDCGLPVITLPGRFMRGRHSYAMLKMMGLSDTIAVDKSDYCRIAVRLARDRDFYQTVKCKLLENQSKLYSDRVFINGLEQFYKSIVHQKIIRKQAANAEIAN